MVLFTLIESRSLGDLRFCLKDEEGSKDLEEPHPKYGATPLMFAIDLGRLRMASAIIEAGVNTSVRSGKNVIFED